MASRWEQFGSGMLQRLADAIIRYPRWFFFPQIALFAFCIWFTVFSPWKLQFDSSRDNLVGGDKKYHQNFLRFKKEFPLPDELVVVVESENMEKNRQFVERLGAKLEVETNLFMDVVYKGDLKMLGSKALLFVPENDLGELRKTLHDYRPFLEQFSQRQQSGVSLRAGEPPVPHRQPRGKRGDDGDDQGVAGIGTHHHAGQRQPSAPGHAAFAGHQRAVRRRRRGGELRFTSRSPKAAFIWSRRAPVLMS